MPGPLRSLLAWLGLLLLATGCTTTQEVAQDFRTLAAINTALSERRKIDIDFADGEQVKEATEVLLTANTIQYQPKIGRRTARPMAAVRRISYLEHSGSLLGFPAGALPGLLLFVSAPQDGDCAGAYMCGIGRAFVQAMGIGLAVAGGIVGLATAKTTRITVYESPVSQYIRPE